MDLSSYHVRRDQLTQQWVACAPSRSGRPKQTTLGTPKDAERGPVEGCPFCPGNEVMLPGILDEITDEHDSWQVRAVPNKFPAFRSDQVLEEATNRVYEGKAARGHQEVIVETPGHYAHWPYLSVSHLASVFRMYQRRIEHVRTAYPDLYPIVFRNQGGRAGASLAHPHSQLIAPPLPPPEQVAEEQRCRTYFETEDSPLLAVMRDQELETERRLVATNDHFVAFVPYAAPAPYSVWIVPRRNNAHFTEITDEERASCATIARLVARRYVQYAEDPDYNMTLHTALKPEAEAPHLVWSLRSTPRVSVRAGFELGTNMLINPSLPEIDADILRGA